MIKFIKKYFIFLLIFAISLAIFFPSLSVFYTNDDFFFLKISNIQSPEQFLHFFNLIKGPDGFAMYRPLTTQAFYFLSWKIFDLNPVGLHIISFLIFFFLIYLVYLLSFELIKNKKIAYIAAFLYATSATHFGHLYYLATFQELGVAIFVILSCIFFIKDKKILSYIFFILALLSKETAVVTPLLIALIYWFQRVNKQKKYSIKKLMLFLLPFAISLGAYLAVRKFSYGFATGDTYIWDFSAKKLLNTVFWYLIWSLNLPETLLDFIGPGLKINPNLFAYWGRQFIPIFSIFFLQGFLLVIAILKSMLSKTKKFMSDDAENLVFCIFWFLISLLPVIFLPDHKFTFYLTLPLVGLAIRISYILFASGLNNIFIGVFLAVWSILSILTVNHTYQVSWITQSEKIAKKVFDYFSENQKYADRSRIYLVDTDKDIILPWSPTSVVRTVLSDKNFFYVFYPNLADKVSYIGSGKISREQNTVIIKSRDFLGY